MEPLNIGFALCGSFCTFSKAIPELEALAAKGHRVYPIMSFNAATLDTRFGKARDHVERIERACGRKVIATLTEAEPIGPKKLLDLLIIAPCTGNTLAKLANGIADTPVTLAAKSHLRNARPLLIAVSTNDGLSGAARNIGLLQSRKHVWFVPYGQDDSEGKPASLVADFTRIGAAAEMAMKGLQIQPMLV